MVMPRLFALPLVLVAFHTSIQPLPAPLRAELNGRFWHPGCPVPLARLRLLTVTSGASTAASTPASSSLRSPASSGGCTSCASRGYLDRSRLRPGMVTPAVVRAFRSIGWGWGGAWAGSTKDYMHFSATGH
jgi:D-alanyl-D-alanine carboxypeptidase